MKRTKTRPSVLSRDDQVQFAKTLRLLTAGKNDSWVRGVVVNARSCKEPGGWPGWEQIYGDMLFKRMADLDVDFFKKLANAIEYVQSGAGEDNPQAAAIAKAWYVLITRDNKFPTIREIAVFAHANSKAVKHWNVDDPNYFATVRSICRRRGLKCRPDKTGRKPK